VGWRAPKKETIRYVDAAVLVLLVGLAGSRAAYVAVNWGYYGSNLEEIVQVWKGGLSGIGALAGALIGTGVIAIWWRLSAGVLADTCLPLAGSMTITSWLGCWVGACAYGAPSSEWWALPGPDEWGVLVRRVPVQLMGALLTLLLLIGLEWLGRRWQTGVTASAGLFGISAVIFGLSYLRSDPMPIWKGLRLEAWGSAALMVLSAGIVVVLLVRWRLRPSMVSSKRTT